jgi:hypothetical protein
MAHPSPWARPLAVVDDKTEPTVPYLAVFLEGAHAAAIGLRGAADQDHRPAILLRIGKASEAVRDTGAGDDDTGAGAALQVAISLRRVRGGLLGCACRYRQRLPFARPRRSGQPETRRPRTNGRYPAASGLLAIKVAPLISLILFPLLGSDGRARCRQVPGAEEVSAPEITHLWQGREKGWAIRAWFWLAKFALMSYKP